MRASRSRGGGQRPTRDEVAANLRAGVTWVSGRDLPDVGAWADFNAAPELVHQRLVSRLKEGRCPSVVATFPLPKPGKNEVRKMAWLNPYDDLYLRIVVGRSALAIESALGPDVFSYRLEDEPPGWSVQDVRRAFHLRRERGEALLADWRCNAMAVSDIRHYYPSLAPEALTRALDLAAAPTGAVRLIDTFLRELKAMGAPRGLPIGPEASGLLGNIVLLAVDEAVADRALGHVRYMDDSWLFLQSESEWSEVYDVYIASASALGLEVNASKVAVHQKGSVGAENAIQHGHIAYLVSGHARYRTPEMAADEIRSQLEQSEPDWAVVGFHLGSLRHTRSAAGLSVLQKHPQILQEMPRNAGRYLATLATDKQARRKIDHDWLIEQATGPQTSRSLAGQLQVCRVASQLRVSKEHGTRLEELATDSGLIQHTPLQAWAARAWGSSKAHSPGRAVDYACHYGDFSVRRAFALTIHPESSTPTKRSCWRRKLGSVDADLLPTLARLH